MAEEELKETEDVICRRCGREAASAPLDVSDDVMKRYMRAALGGKAFTTTFQIMDGKFTAEFQEIPADLADKLQKIVSTLPLNSQKSLDAAVDYKLLFTLKKLEFLDDDGVLTSKYDCGKLIELSRNSEKLDCEKLFNDFSKNFNEVMLGMLRRMSITFALLLKAIADKLISSDFYKGAGLL